MRIVFLGNFGVDYSSETHHKKSLEALGHEVISLQETQAGSEEILAESYKSDMFVWVHTHGWQTPGNIPMSRVLQRLKAKGIPTVTYHLDLWFGLQRQNDLRKDAVYKDIEWFFTVDKQMADWFNQNTRVKGRYLPAGVFHEEMLLDDGIQKVNDVMFVGSKGYHPEWPYRPKLIDWLKETYGDRFKHVGGDSEIGVVRGHALTGLYNATKVVVGDSLVKDFKYPYYWSDRLYETLGRGGFMIFPKIEGLENEFYLGDGPFTDDMELVTYDFNDFDGLKYLIDYYIDHPGEREKVRRRGFEKVRDNYTYKHRWATILKEVGLQ